MVLLIKIMSTIININLDQPSKSIQMYKLKFKRIIVVIKASYKPPNLILDNSIFMNISIRYYNLN